MIDDEQIAGDLDAIIGMALSAEPERRYRTAVALADDLERFLAHPPVMAQSDSWAYRAGKFVARNARTLGVAAAVSTALLAGMGLGVGFVLWQRKQTAIEHATLSPTAVPVGDILRRQQHPLAVNSDGVDFPAGQTPRATNISL